MFKKLCCLAMLASALFADPYVTEGKVKKVTDGDTITFVDVDGTQFKCRIYGIDTPESLSSSKLEKDAANLGVDTKYIQEAGRAASAYAKNSLPLGATAIIQIYGSDKYDRNLCVVYVEGDETSYNERAVRDGYAVVYKHGKSTKDKELRHKLNVAQGEAAKNRNGLWYSSSDIMTSLANN
jgi:nuclease (SNase domain protein)